MIVFPNAKINLGLQVLRKRPDGYHDLESVFYPIPLTDILELVRCDANTIIKPSFKTGNTETINLKKDKMLRISISGNEMECDLKTNLITLACLAFDEKFGINNHLWLHLHKLIPTGAGLGGGSADAAYTLRLLNELEDFPATAEQLHQVATGLGSDCPFFLLNKPAFASGRGEVLTKIPMQLEHYFLVVVKPPLQISTAQAFAELSIKAKDNLNIERLINTDISNWKNKLHNDFEKGIFTKYPEIEIIRNSLYENGAVYASLSGSGSAVYGLFTNEISLREVFPGYFYFESWLYEKN